MIRLLRAAMVVVGMAAVIVADALTDERTRSLVVALRQGWTDEPAAHRTHLVEHRGGLATWPDLGGVPAGDGPRPGRQPLRARVLVPGLRQGGGGMAHPAARMMEGRFVA